MDATETALLPDGEAGLLCSSQDRAWLEGSFAHWQPNTSDDSMAGSSIASEWVDSTLAGVGPLGDPFLDSLDDMSTDGAAIAVGEPGAASPAQTPLVDEPPPAAPRELLVYASLGEGCLGVLVCTLCRMAPEGPSWNKMARHWRPRNHKDSPPEVTLEERVLARETWERHSANVLRSADQWTPPEHPIEPVEHVEVISAYQCKSAGCSLRYIKASSAHHRSDATAWREHQRREHDVVEFDAVGRPAVSSAIASRAENSTNGEDAAPWGRLVRAQRLFRRRPYHPVCDLNAAAPEQGEKNTAGAAWLQQFDELAAVTRRDDAERLECIAGPATHEINAWARAAGFSTRLQHYQWTAARRICDRPRADDEEAVAAAVWRLAGLAMQKSHERARRAGTYMCELVNRTYPNMQPVQPWTAYTSDGSLADHTRTMQACLTLFARTQRDPAAAAAVPPYEVDLPVRQAWAELQQHLLASRCDIVPGESLPAGTAVLTQGEKLTLVLLVRLLQQQGSINEAKELPLIVALTVLGIVPGKNCFYQAGEYSRVLAGFSKMARAAVLTYAVDVDSAEMVGLVEGCLVRGPNHTMNWLGRTKAYARAVDRSTPRQGRLAWVPRSETYIYGEYQLSLQQLRAIIHGALARQTRILCEELLFVQSTAELPANPWDRLVDRLDHQPRGSCWTDPANEAALRPGVNWLRDHVAQTQEERFLGRAGHEIQERAVLQFRQSMQSFAEQGMPLAVWAVGMPIRGTTVTSYRWRNSDNGDELRNLVVQGCRLTLVGGHTKAQWAGAEAPMHVLPAEVADLWAWYVWLVMPFWSTIRSHDRQAHEAGDASFLFPAPGKRAQASSEWVSMALKESSASVVPGGIGLQPGRQLLVGFTRRYIPSDMLAGGTSAQLDARRQPESRQAAMARAGAHVHTTATADEDEDEDEDGDTAMQGDVGAGLMQTSEGRNVFLEVRQMMASRSAIEIQTGHSTRMGYTMYGGDVQAIPGIDELQLALWSTVSNYWHLVLRFPSALAREYEKRRVKRARPVAEREEDEDRDQDSVEMRRVMSVGVASTPRKRMARAVTLQQDTSSVDPGRAVTEESALQCLQDLLQHPSAAFRGNQWPALNAILNQSCQSLLVVEPTGGGKSIIFMLPAALAGARTTLVVTPFVALRKDLVERCLRAGVACAVWRGDADPNLGLYLHAKIILVSAEQLDQPRFRNLVHTLQGAQQLERIVVDEAHLPLIARHWRHALKRYDILATLGVPVVMLSATLPVAHEARLFAGMGIEPAYARVLRSSTVRRNIAYRVAPLDGIPGHAGIAKAVLQHRAAFPQGARKTMVFVNDKTIVKSLAKFVPETWAFYYDVPDGEHIMQCFRDAADGILFCTSAADHGIDVPDVDHIIHASWPDNFSSYLQGAGRAGRDGRAAVAVLLVGRGVHGFSLTTPQAIQDRQLLVQYAQKKLSLDVARCRRSFIDEYMDGDVLREHCKPDEGEEMCDVCAARVERHLSDATSTGKESGEVGTSIIPHAGLSGDTDLPVLVHSQTVKDQAVSVVPETPPPSYRRDGAPADLIQQSYCSSLPNSAPSASSSASRCTRTTASSMSTPSASGSFEILRTQLTSSPLSMQPSKSCTLPAIQQPAQCLLNRNRQLECMSWRALWGKNGAARPPPLHRIRSTLLFWKYNCKAHLLEGGDHSHTNSDCHELATVHSQIKTASQPWNSKATFTMEPYTGCMWCKVPKELCHVRGKCTNEWKHVVVDAWATCLLYPASSKWYTATLQKRNLVDTDSAAVRKYLGKKISVMNRPSNRIETMPLIDMLVEMTELFFLPQTANLGSLVSYSAWDRE